MEKIARALEYDENEIGNKIINFIRIRGREKMHDLNIENVKLISPDKIICPFAPIKAASVKATWKLGHRRYALHFIIATYLAKVNGETKKGVSILGNTNSAALIGQIYGLSHLDDEVEE